MLKRSAEDAEAGLIPHGMGRSYGDSALNARGIGLQTTEHQRVLAFDTAAGVIRAEAGLTLDNLLKIVVPKGWFPVVTPGTKYVTLGGMVANDVHGKNHHEVGSIGAHVTRLRLVRSDREKPTVCSPTRNAPLFRATIGGLGLTGLIDWVELQLKPVRSAFLDVENLPMGGLEDFFRLSGESADWPYSVAWVDCFAPARHRGRGIFTRARFTDYGQLKVHEDPGRKSLPFSLPSLALNRLSMKMFNALYRWRPGARYLGRQHYDPFFYPLDGLANWNRMYGRRGFHQHQCLIPSAAARDGIAAMLDAIRQSGQGSFLAVLKEHGPEPSPGVLSFGRSGPGTSLALDFANRGPRTLTLLDRLDTIVLDHGGTLYPAKDGRMSAATFQAAYPQWETVEALRDPALMSDFWRRVSTPATVDA